MTYFCDGCGTEWPDRIDSPNSKWDKARYETMSGNLCPDCYDEDKHTLKSEVDQAFGGSLMGVTSGARHSSP